MTSPNLEQLKKQAKELLRAARGRDAAALARLRILPAFARLSAEPFARAAFALHDAQSALAREQGYPSWNALRDAVEAQTLTFQTAQEEFLRAATGESPDRAERLLALHPDIAGASFHAALLLGDAGKVAAELNRDPRLARQPGGPHGWEPLLYVCHTCLHRSDPSRLVGIVTIAKSLLAAGADPNRVYEWHWHAEVPRTPLWSALCSMRSLELAEALLAGGANPNDGVSVHMSAGQGLIENLELLLRHNASVDGSPGGLPPLAYIMAWGKGDAGIRWLLGHGADSNLPRTDTGERPVHAAAVSRDVRIFELLEQHGANLGAVRPDGRTAFAIATLNGNAEVAAWLAARGHTGDLLPLDRFVAACSCGDRAAAAALVQEYPAIAAELQPAHHRLLRRAAERENCAPLAVMLEFGFDPNTPDPEGVTPLHWAAWCGRPENVRLLLAKGANVHAIDGMFSASPLLWAAQGRQDDPRPGGDAVATARLLLAAGVSPDWDPPPSVPNAEHAFEILAALRQQAAAQP